MDKLEYKGYYGSIEYSWDDNCLFGEVMGLEHACIGYEGDTVAELFEDFKDSIDFYLESCSEDNRMPEKSKYMDVRIPVYVYERIDKLADKSGMNFSSFIDSNIPDSEVAEPVCSYN